MTHTVKRTFAMLFVAVFGSALLYNCEPEADSLGEQLFINDGAESNMTSYDLVAYNINNKDSIRSDAGRLVSLINTSGISTATAVLGAFNEGQFGMQKASFLTQLRMSSDNFDFGKTPKVDSVVLVMKPRAVTDSVKTSGAKDESILIGTVATPVSTEVKTYPVDYRVKYGKTKLGAGGTNTLLHVNVDEITTFLDGNDNNFKYSNVNVGTGAALGSAVFDGNVKAVTITKKSDNSTLFAADAGFRIRLNNDFFQTKILDKSGKPELKDAANFTRYFKGIRLSVDETDGYLLQFSPDDLEVIMYYTNEKNDNGTITRPQSSFKLLMKGGLGNARIGQYTYDRTNSKWENAIGSINETEGNDRLYLQGMGGPSIGVKIPESTINSLRTLYDTNKAAIVSAKIRIYTDEAVWKNNLRRKQENLTISPIDSGTPLLTSSAFLADITAGFDWLKSAIDQDPSYYEFTVTKTVKDIIEGNPLNNGVRTENKLLLINMGEFTPTTANTFGGFKFTSRAFETERAVFVGSKDKNNKYRMQLKVTYGTKK
ncbi:DUF4270 domain-containing protein [Chryseobacterium herbae]|uniref:DUF4270 domain-containing protein n=1 Tax=Chryseobacterium herbae TaxID=2976476 RepID=A0ABT2IR06_9FLAO|nr:DUF4270 domain-containing protein [Chryseobacterium sp. pc1-10]MCT2561254.1 DUF4270 domain-containing protein [Chryseobacterium sp. pc1-10]